MTEEELILTVDKAWEIEDGFFYEIRSLKFDKEKGEKLYQSLAEAKLREGLVIQKKTVRLIWYIPIFLEYQKDSLKSVLDEADFQDYLRLSNRIQSDVERLLGCP